MSEWLDIMLDEIAKRRADEQAAEAEAARRAAEEQPQAADTQEK